MPAANVAVARISACSWPKPASRKACRTADGQGFDTVFGQHPKTLLHPVVYG